MFMVLILSSCFMYLIVQGNTCPKNAPINVLTGKCSAEMSKA